MPLTDWQFSYGGTTFINGTKYGLVSVTGLYDGSTSPNDLAKTGNGTYAARDRVDGKQVIFQIEVADTAGATFAATFQTFLAALPVPSNTDATLQWKVPGITNNRKLTGRFRRRAFPVDLPLEAGRAVVMLEFFATDPQVYDATTNGAVDY